MISRNFCKKLISECKYPQHDMISIRSYTYTYTLQEYIDTKSIAQGLYSKYPSEYGRDKFKVFLRNKVEPAFEDVMKKAAEVNLESESESETQTKVESTKINKTMTDLYASPNPKSDSDKIKAASKITEKASPHPKSDFDKIKADAKNAEKSLVNGNSPKPKPTNNGSSKESTENKKKPEESTENKKKPVEVSLTKRPSVDLEIVEVTKPKEAPKVIDLDTNDEEKKTRTRSASPTSKPAKRKKVEVATFKEPKVSFKDVAGVDDKLVEFLDIVQALELDPLSSQRSVLLHGPPGSGKTLLANSIAGELKWPLLEVTATDIVSGISGESEAKLRSLFDQAINLNQKCIVFIDDIDVIAQKKDNSSASRGMDNRIISQLKTCVSGLQKTQVLCIGATSHLENLDLTLRALFYEVAIGVPNEKARQKILEKITSTMNTEDLDLHQLSRYTPSYVGRDFEALRFEALKVAFRRTIQQKYSKCNDLSLRVKLLKEWDEHKDLSELKVRMEDFLAAIKNIQPAAKREGFATVPDVTWEDVGAMNQVRREIEVRVLDRVNHPEKAEAYNLQAPTGILLCGPPGCGKTLVAKAMANQAGINFISVKGPELLNMVSGEYFICNSIFSY